MIRASDSGSQALYHYRVCILDNFTLQHVRVAALSGIVLRRDTDDDHRNTLCT